jgi:hypothetical protein
MALAPDYDPLAEAIKANDPPSNVAASSPSSDYDPLVEAEKRQASPLKTAYQNGAPVPWATTPDQDEWGGKPGSQGMPLVSGLIRGVLDTADTGTNVLGSVFSTKADADATRARLAADRDEWNKKYGDSTAAGAGRFTGQLASTAGPVGLIGRGIGLATQGLPAALRLLTQGAAQGGAQAAMTASASDKSTGEQVAEGAIAGGVAGPVAGGLTRAIDVLRGFYGGIRPEIAALADRAMQRGINIPVSGMMTNPQLKMFVDALRRLPGTGEDAAALARQRQFQGALNREAGSTATTMGNAEMTAMRNRISNGYDAALNQVTAIPHGPQLINDLSNVGANATARLRNTETLGYVGDAIREVNNQFGLAARHGGFTGANYKSLTGSKGPLAEIERLAGDDAAPYLQQIRDALRQQLTRSAPPGTAADLLRLDREWRAMHTIRPLAEKSTVGDIQPSALLQSTINQSRKFDGPVSGVAFNNEPLTELGRIGKQFFGHIPESGTAPRTQAYSFAQHPLATTAGFIPGMVFGRPLRAWLDNPTVARRVIDTSLGAPVPDISRAVPVTSLLGLDAQR